MAKKYKVIKPFAGYVLGAIVTDDSLRIRRKLEEGGCLEEIKTDIQDKKSLGRAPENKKMPDDYKTKSGGKK